LSQDQAQRFDRLTLLNLKICDLVKIFAKPGVSSAPLDLPDNLTKQ
jgi:hypothetical protein